MGGLILFLIVMIMFCIFTKKQANKEQEKHYERMQGVIKDAIKQALNEKEEEFINDDDFGPFDESEDEENA